MRQLHLLAVPLLMLSGCGAASVPSAAAKQAASDATMASVLQKGNPAISGTGENKKAGEGQAARKVIYKATLDLVVTDFDAAETRLRELLGSSGGYIDELSEDRRLGSQRFAKWVVRIPADAIHKFLAETARLGVTQSRGLAAEDVTEEFVDLDARLKSKRQLESRLLELIAARAGDIRDLASLESELARVREEIERMEGRVRFLSDRVAMSTITITMREEQHYVPPEAPTFAGRISHVFFQSLDLLRQMAEEIVLCVVAVAPFAIALLLLSCPVALLLYRVLRRRPVPARPTVV